MALQNLYGNELSSTLTKCDTFPNLELLTIEEILFMVFKLSKNKAIALNFCQDIYMDAIMKSHKIAKQFTNLWSSSITNKKLFEKHLTERLVPLNKVHPEIPKPEEMKANYSFLSSYKINRI